MRRPLCPILIFLAAASSVVAAWGADANSKPNVLFILTDDQGRNTLECYGGAKAPTPNIDSLARDGMLFTDAYVMPQCTPTRASLLTGQHTARNGMWHVLGWYGYPWAPIAEPAFVEQLPREAFTLPKGLRAAGYTTGMGGKWHLTTNADGSYTNLKAEAGDAYGFDFVAPPGPGTPGQGDKWVDHLTDQAIGFIEKNRERPWFYYLAHHTIHQLVTAPRELIEKYRAAGAPENGMYSAAYLAAIEHLDRSVGRLLAKLDALGLRERTIVVFLSDNGGVQSVYDPQDFSKGAGGGLKQLRVEREEFSNAPFRAGKGSPYEGGLRVPCLVRWPAVVKAGSRCETPVHVVDWLPTLFVAVGAKPPPDYVVDGADIGPLLRGEAIPSRSLYWYLPLYDLRWGATPCAVVRDGDWKLIDYFGDAFDAGGKYRRNGESELFNLRNDLGELHDLASQEPDRAAAMRRQLRQWIQNTGAVTPGKNPYYDPQKSFCETREKQAWNQAANAPKR